MEYNQADPILKVGEIHNYASGEEDSLLSKVGDALTKGVPLAVASGLYSMRNTVASLGNTLGLDTEEKDFKEVVEEYDDNLLKYYEKNQEAIDLTGFVATSFIPGTAGMKALKVVQAGKAGNFAQKATGFFANAERKFLEAAKSNIQRETNQVFAALDSNKMGAIIYGMGDEVLQATAFETAVMLTMNQNPVINKDNETYFKAIGQHWDEIVKGALIGGGVGGTLRAFKNTGELKAAVKLRDKEDFPSINIPELGLNNLQIGDKIAADFSFLRNLEARVDSEVAANTINERQLNNWTQSIARKTQEIREQINNTLANGDVELGESIWKHLNSITDGSSRAFDRKNAVDTAVTLFGSAEEAKRLTVDDAIAVPKMDIRFNGDALSPRQAANIYKRNNIAQGVFDPSDAAAMTELAALEKELFYDASGVLHVVPGTKYAKQTLAKAPKEKVTHSLITKLVGDEAGRITEIAYPVAGDLGSVKYLKDGQLKIGEEIRKLPDAFDPVTNSPLDSSAQFLREKLSPKFKVGEELDEADYIVSSLDLPRIEKAYIEKFEDIIIQSPDGELFDDTVGNVLKGLKLQKRQELIEAGHDFDRIARELNVSREFAETGRGEFALGAVEDHSKPLYAKFEYRTENTKDKHYMRGVADLMRRVETAMTVNQTAAAAILGESYNLLPKTQGRMLGVSTLPELGGFLSSASENYGSFGQLMQQAGRVVNETIRKRMSATIENYAQYEQVIRQDKNLVVDLNLTIAKLRAFSDAPVRVPDEVVARINEAVPGAIVGTALTDTLGVGLTRSPLVLVGRTHLKKLESLAENNEKFASAVEELLKDPRNLLTVPKAEIADFLAAQQKINAARADGFNKFFAAKGSPTVFDTDTFYVPPINTRKYAHVAFVRERAESSFRPVSVLTATDAASLEAKIRTVRSNIPEVEVFTTQDVANFKKLQGDYESGLLLGSSTVDSALKKNGILSDFAPRTDEVIFDDYINWHWQQEQSLVRNATELTYGQQFAELRAMGRQFDEIQKSKFGEKTVLERNPFQKYIDTGLDISNPGKYDSVWGKINEGVEGFGQSMFKIWDTVFSRAKNGEISWTEANAEAKRLGFRPPYEGVLKEVFNPGIQDKKVLEPIVAKVNSAISTFTLGWDFLHTIVNVLGTPALMAAELNSIKRNLANPEIVGKLSALTTEVVPGSQIRMPNTLRMVQQSLSDFVKGDLTKLEYYKSIGAVPDDIVALKSTMDLSRLTAADIKDAVSASQFANKLVEKVAETGRTITGSRKSELFVRYMAAHMMDNIATTAGLQGAEKAAYINTFVTRVHGNYLASQRPQLFQGVVGQAISLFQTFQFNVLQNTVRYLEQNDKMAVASLLGMQNAIFGLQGNPAFYLLNNHIGNSNRDNTDIVKGVYQVVGQDLGDWMLYGLGSNALQTNLYNRGDLTPRYVTVVPTTLSDIPAVSIPLKALGNVLNTFSNAAGGAPIGESILRGIAQNGVNRPFAGLGQIAQGYRTSADGNMLVAYNDVFSFTTAAKLAGGEELDNSIALDAYYRSNAYRANDRAQIEKLGAKIKMHIQAGTELTESDVQDFMRKYAQAGGNPESFNRFLAAQYKSAKQSQINKIMSGMNSSQSRYFATVIGGRIEDLESSSTQPSGSVASVPAQ